ncbi:MAG TPA: GNAT family N-acetyltransferase [Ktedonobacterales bacterium]|nr:GNAT family N-acetyltransferase [Ktedonobacterales bacterium]
MPAFSPWRLKSRLESFTLLGCEAEPRERNEEPASSRRSGDGPEDCLRRLLLVRGVRAGGLGGVRRMPSRRGFNRQPQKRGRMMTIERLTTEAMLVEENWAAAWASLREAPVSPPTLVEETPNYLRIITPGVADSLLNIIMRYTAQRPVTRDDVEEAIAPFRRAHVPMQWWLMRGSEPAGLREQLALLGMESWGGAAAMTLRFDGWHPPTLALAKGVTLGLAQGDEDRRAALNIICAVFYAPLQPMNRWTIDNPRFTMYLARLGGRPVAALAIFTHQRIAGVYHVATLASARRRGIAGALLTRALKDAQAAGCAYATLTATPEAKHLYEQVGFTTCGVMEQWSPGYRLAFSLVQGREPTLSENPYWEG